MMFEKFRDLMVEKMETTAGEELAKKFNIRRLEKSNQNLVQKIEGNIK